MSQRQAKKQLLNSGNRRKYGCITTWEAPDGSTLTLHRNGATLAACLRIAAAIALAENEDYKLAAYCTPETIHSDLIGVRVDALHPPRGFKATYSKAMPRAFVENIVLGQAGLPKDLIHPRLVRLTAKERRA